MHFKRRRTSLVDGYRELLSIEMTVDRPNFLSSLKCRPLESAAWGAGPPSPPPPAATVLQPNGYPNSANPARNLAGTGLGRISEKWPNSGFAGDESRYNRKELSGCPATEQLTRVSD